MKRCACCNRPSEACAPESAFTGQGAPQAGVQPFWTSDDQIAWICASCTRAAVASWVRAAREVLETPPATSPDVDAGA